MKDSSELFKSISENQKLLFFTFVVTWPIIYVILYLFIDGFNNHDLVNRLIFSAAGAIVMIVFTFIALVILNNNLDIRRVYLAIFIAAGTLIVCLFRENVTCYGLLTGLTVVFIAWITGGLLWRRFRKK